MRYRALCLAVLALPLMSGLLPAAPLDPRTNVLACYRLPAGARADGDMTKWKGVPPSVTPEQFKVGETDKTMTPTPEFSPTIYIGRPQGSADLLILVVVQDPCVVTGESAGWLFGDCMELFLDFGREARDKASADWWKTPEKTRAPPEMSQFGFGPAVPGKPVVCLRPPIARKWTIECASLPVRGGFLYEVRVDSASVFKDLNLQQLPGVVGIDFMMRAADYPVTLDGAGWANHRGLFRLFGTWTVIWSPATFGALSTDPRDPQGTGLPAQTLEALYGKTPTFDDLRALIGKQDGDAVAELLYWLVFKGQMPDAKLVQQVMALDSPQAREVCLSLMLDSSQDGAARRAAAERAYLGYEKGTTRGLVAANLLHREFGHGHGTELVQLLRHSDGTVAFTAAQALAATGNADDLAAFEKAFPAILADLQKDPAQASRAAATRLFMQPALDEMTCRLHPPAAPKAKPLRTVKHSNTDLPRIFASDNNTVYDGADLARTWPKDGPRELWRYEVGGGMSAVTEAGGRAFTMGQQSNKTYALCLDAATGHLLWRQAMIAQAPGHCAATPLLDGTERAYYAAQGAVVCYRAADGTELWRQEKDYGGPTFSTPVLYGDLLLVPGSTLVAADKLTGAVKWRTAGPAASPSSPAIQILDGLPQAVLGVGAGANAEVWGISLQDGSVFWKVPIRGDYGLCASPVVDGTRVLLSGGETGKEFFSILRMFVNNGRIGALALLTRSDVQANYANTMAVWDNAVYGYGDGGLQCVDARDGRVLWTDRNNWQRDLQLIVADGLVFVQTANELALVRAGKQRCEVLARFTAPVKLGLQQPTLANGRLYVRGETQVLCYDVRGGK